MVLDWYPILQHCIPLLFLFIDFKWKKRESYSLYLHYESHLPPCPRPTQNLTYEIILTLGQAFEVAYQLALQAQRTKQHQNPPAGLASDVVETRSSKPVPRPRGSIRKSAVSWAASSTETKRMETSQTLSLSKYRFWKKNADAVAQVEEKYESLKNDFSPDCSHLHQLQTHYCNATGHLLRNVYVFQFRKGWLITRASLPPWFHSEIRGKDLSLRRLPVKWHE